MRSEKNMKVPPFCLPPNVCLATSAMVPIPSPTASPAEERQTPVILRLRSLSSYMREAPRKSKSNCKYIDMHYFISST